MAESRFLPRYRDVRFGLEGAADPTRINNNKFRGPGQSHIKVWEPTQKLLVEVRARKKTPTGVLASSPQDHTSTNEKSTSSSTTRNQNNAARRSGLRMNYNDDYSETEVDTMAQSLTPFGTDNEVSSEPVLTINPADVEYNPTHNIAWWMQNTDHRALLANVEPQTAGRSARYADMYRQRVVGIEDFSVIWAEEKQKELEKRKEEEEKQRELESLNQNVAQLPADPEAHLQKNKEDKEEQPSLPNIPQIHPCEIGHDQNQKEGGMGVVASEKAVPTREQDDRPPYSSPTTIPMVSSPSTIVLERSGRKETTKAPKRAMSEISQGSPRKRRATPGRRIVQAAPSPGLTNSLATPLTITTPNRNPAPIAAYPRADLLVSSPQTETVARTILSPQYQQMARSASVPNLAQVNHHGHATTPTPTRSLPVNQYLNSTPGTRTEAGHFQPPSAGMSRQHQLPNLVQAGQHGHTTTPSLTRRLPMNQYLSSTPRIGTGIFQPPSTGMRSDYQPPNLVQVDQNEHATTPTPTRRLPVNRSLSSAPETGTGAGKFQPPSAGMSHGPIQTNTFDQTEFARMHGTPQSSPLQLELGQMREQQQAPQQQTPGGLQKTQINSNFASTPQYNVSTPVAMTNDPTRNSGSQPQAAPLPQANLYAMSPYSLMSSPSQGYAPSPVLLAQYLNQGTPYHQRPECPPPPVPSFHGTRFCQCPDCQQQAPAFRLPETLDLQLPGLPPPVPGVGEAQGLGDSQGHGGGPAKATKDNSAGFDLDFMDFGGEN